MFHLFLITHIITGLVCLITGVVAMSREKRKGSIRYQVRYITGHIYWYLLLRLLCLFFIGKKVLIYFTLAFFPMLLLYLVIYLQKLDGKTG